MKKMLQRSTHLLLSMSVAILLPIQAFAGDWNTNQNGVVLDGFDVVSYRSDNKATKGSSNFKAKYDGATFYFSNKKHRNMFTKNPKLYIPKYNGYCAFAVGAKNAKVPANADTFKIYNGELLVFFNDYHDGNKFNTKIPWNSNEKTLFSQAESNWSKLK